MLCTNIVLNVKRNKVDSRTPPTSIAVKKTIFEHNMFRTCIFLAIKWTTSRHIVGYITLNWCKNEGFWKRFICSVWLDFKRAQKSTSRFHLAILLQCHLNEQGTIHLRRRQIFTIFEPTPLPSPFQQNAYEGYFWSLCTVTFGPSAYGDTSHPLRHADVLNEWSLM
jgi:hypothetical protein